MWLATPSSYRTCTDYSLPVSRRTAKDCGHYQNVWQFLRDNWLSNRVFKSYDDLVDHCCVAWNKLVNQPWRIMSIGLRQWAHRF